MRPVSLLLNGAGSASAFRPAVRLKAPGTILPSYAVRTIGRAAPRLSVQESANGAEWLERNSLEIFAPGCGSGGAILDLTLHALFDPPAVGPQDVAQEKAS